MKSEESPDVRVLTPTSIPEYAKLTGRSEKELMEAYHEAKAQNKVLYGLYCPPSWWIDEVSSE